MGLVKPIRSMARGVLDSTNVVRLYQTISIVKKIHLILKDHFVLNFAIVFGWELMWLFNVKPFYLWMFTEKPIIITGLQCIYSLFWIYPVTILCFGFNILYNRDICVIMNQILNQGKPPVSLKLTDVFIVASEEIYRVILSTCLIIQLSIIEWLTNKLHHYFVVYVIGQILVNFHLAIYYSMFCFEYRWYALNWTIMEKINTIEREWIYFIGFGAIQVLLNKYLPSTIFVCLVPYFILLALVSNFDQSPSLETQARIPLFTLVRFLVNKCLSRAQKSNSFKS
jgi:hypothetical protein